MRHEFEESGFDKDYIIYYCPERGFFKKRKEKECDAVE